MSIDKHTDKEVPAWDDTGVPTNAQAAMSDALLWLDILHVTDEVNRGRLDACKAMLVSFGAIENKDYKD